jgi:hypothetical protein
MRFYLLIFLSFPLFALSQITFNNLYKTDFYFLGSGILEEDDGYTVTGQQTTTTDRKITLTKINLLGDSITHKIYDDNGKIFYTGRNIIKRNNDYILFGTVISDANDNNTADVFLASFNFSYDLNWIKTYGGNLYDKGTDLLQNPDGSLLICGSKSISMTNEDFFLVKTDPDGNVIWEKTYGGTNTDVANSIIFDFENEYLLSGFSNSFSSSYDLLIYYVDLDGNIKEQINIGGSLTDYPGIACKVGDKTHVLYKNESAVFPNTVAKLIKINPNGEIIWTKNFPNSNGYAALEFTKPIELADGSIILTGVFMNATQNPIAKILKLDPLGNIIWQRDYVVRDDRQQYIHDIQITSDGGFVFCGSAFDSTNTQRNWVAKLDCFGCDGVLCDSSNVACELYDCTTKDFEADIQASALSVELYNANHTLSFSDNASQSSNREWILPDTTLYTTGSISYTFDTPGTYPITLINYHGVCSDTSVVMVEVGYGLGLKSENESEKEVLIHPNPNDGSFNVLLPNDCLSGKFKIYDIYGKLCLEQIIDSSIINLGLNLSKGVFVFVVENQSLMYQGRFVVK